LLPADAIFLGHPPDQPLALVVWQPARVARGILQDEEYDHSDHGCWDAFEEKQLLPAVQAGHTVAMNHDPAGDRVAEDVRDADGQHEEGSHLGPFAVREPVRKVVDDARKEPRLGDAEENPQGVEGSHVPCEHRGDRDQPPSDHDAGDPGRAPIRFISRLLGSSKRM